MGWGSYEGGRPKLSDEHKRKNKQFRISDNEMEFLGNPSTTEIRKRLLKLKAIEEFCDQADRNGVQIIPDECLELIGLDKSCRFENSMYFSSNFTKLSTIANEKFRKYGDCEETWDQTLKGFKGFKGVLKGFNDSESDFCSENIGE